ncbi:MAG: L-2-amino-thiazoline-4-carboxylic acid hydrolase [Candidatus Bathyarchaeia archaeon]|jgi:hypothetical protein
MGLRLRFLCWWTPKYFIRRELENVSNQTTAALQALLEKYAPKEPAIQAPLLSKSIDEQRLNMAQTHVKMVEALQKAVGQEKAVRLGRAALFSVGENLGQQTRVRLGVGDNRRDLVKAARILYRVLGINFRIEQADGTNVEVTIDRCALAKKYSKLTCEVLSATDEGVIKGLQPDVRLKFNQYMTSGCENCKANLIFNVKETTT